MTREELVKQMSNEFDKKIQDWFNTLSRERETLLSNPYILRLTFEPDGNLFTTFENCDGEECGDGPRLPDLQWFGFEDSVELDGALLDIRDASESIYFNVYEHLEKNSNDFTGVEIISCSRDGDSEILEIIFNL